MTYPGQRWPGDPGGQVQVWTWPGAGFVERVGARPAPPAVPVRIGDVERDRAISALSDHFAAGRLSREELDERVDQAMQARFDADLRPLFADLPRPEPTAPIRPVPAYPSGVAVAFATLFWLLPMLLVVGVLAAVLAGAPWLLWGLLWVVILMKIFGRRHRYHSHRPRH